MAGHKGQTPIFLRRLRHENRCLSLIIADKSGRIFHHPSLEAVGMKAGQFYRLDGSELIKLPNGSQLFALPDRYPVGYDSATEEFIENKNYRAVAAFVSPGYTITYSSAYEEAGSPRPLPLFAYGAVAFYKGSIYAAAIRIDNDPRHATHLVDSAKVKSGVRKLKKLMPHNRLIPHLERCAFGYGCPNAQNFFLNRYEAPLPTSPACNAACAGCISYQPGKDVCASQPRIKFIPRPDELAQVALYHIENVKNPIVSFGQGCEGEPLLQAGVIEKAIKIIRACTSKGTINMNTNGSRPDLVAKLFDAGLDSIRISLNSARPVYYTRYYKPRGYRFADVIKSIKVSKEKGGFVSLNYLVMPGFTDREDEFCAMNGLIAKYKPDMLQLRNLNYDPLLYFKNLKIPKASSKSLLGIRQLVTLLQQDFPRLKLGYFNPSSREAAFRRR